MTNKVKPIPDGYHSITPYLVVKDAAKAIEFYKKAFDAKERFVLHMAPNKVAHAEMQIGDSVIMLSDEFPEMGAKSPQSIGGSPVYIHLYVKDVDSFFNKAVSAGGKVLRPLENQFYGDRTGGLVDPFGHIWSIGTHIKDVSKQEMERAMQEMSKKHS